MKKSVKTGVLLAIYGMAVLGLPKMARAATYTNARWDSFTTPSLTASESDTANEFNIDSWGNGSGITVTDGVNVTVEATNGSNRAVNPPEISQEKWWGAHIDGGSALTLKASENNELTGLGKLNYGVGVWDSGSATLEAQQDNKLTACFIGAYAGKDVYSNSSKSVTLKAGNDNVISASSTSVYPVDGKIHADAVHAEWDQSEIEIHAVGGDNTITSTAKDSAYGVVAINGGKVTLKADAGSNAVTASTIGLRALKQPNQTVTLLTELSVTAQKDNKITVTGSTSESQAIFGNTAKITVTAQEGDNVISSKAESGYAGGIVTFTSLVEGAGTVVKALKGNNTITADTWGVFAVNGKITVSAPEGNNIIKGADALDSYYYAGNLTVETEKGTNIIDGTAGDGVKSAYGGSAAVKGQSQIEAAGAALFAEAKYPNVDKAPSVAVEYDGDTTIDGVVIACDTGIITVTPRDTSYFPHQQLVMNSDLIASWANPDASTGQDADPSTYRGGQIDVHLTDGSKLTGTASNASNPVAFADRGTERMGIINLTMDGSSLWTMTGSSAISNLSGTGGTVHFENGGDHLEITDRVSGPHRYDMDLSYADKTHSDMLYARTGTADHQTLNVKNLAQLNSEMGVGDAVRYATVMTDSGGGFLGNDYVVANGIYNDTLKTEYRTAADDPDRADTYAATHDETYGVDDATNIYLVKAEEKKNTGSITPGNARDLIWRYVTDLDTFTKRDGQSQYFTDEGDRGGWVRLGYRNLGIDGVGEVDGNTYELGWTTISRQNEERKHRFSASVAYAKPKGHFEGYGGSLTVRDFSVNLYDTHEYYPAAEQLAGKPEWKKASHAYWDNYLKYHHVKTEYSAFDRATGLKYDGDYDQDIWNLSTEYGHKLMLDTDWFWVPQAQLQLSYLGGYDYRDSQKLHVDGDHDWSLIGRLGFDLVRDIHDSRDSKLYFKASLLHEFMDGNDVTIDAFGRSYRDEGDQSGTWGVIGIGYSSKIGEQQYFYIDAERYVGHDFDRTYDIRAGVNWKF
jgi:outer membrane autotransporter protein